MDKDLEWLYDYLFQFLKSPGWKVPILDFIDDNCEIFEESEENKLAYTTIYEKFKDLIDNLLDSICINIGINYDQFFFVCSLGVKNQAHHKTFEQILACDNFPSFKRLMIKRNQHLEREALRTLPKVKKKLDTDIDKAIQMSIEESKRLEKMKMIEEKEIKRAMRISEEEFRREQDLKRRANRNSPGYYDTKVIKRVEIKRDTVVHKIPENYYVQRSHSRNRGTAKTSEFKDKMDERPEKSLESNSGSAHSVPKDFSLEKLNDEAPKSFENSKDLGLESMELLGHPYEIGKSVNPEDEKSNESAKNTLQTDFDNFHQENLSNSYEINYSLGQNNKIDDSCGKINDEQHKTNEDYNNLDKFNGNYNKLDKPNSELNSKAKNKEKSINTGEIRKEETKNDLKINSNIKNEENLINTNRPNKEDSKMTLDPNKNFNNVENPIKINENPFKSNLESTNKPKNEETLIKILEMNNESTKINSGANITFSKEKNLEDTNKLDLQSTQITSQSNLKINNKDSVININKLSSESEKKHLESNLKANNEDLSLLTIKTAPELEKIDLQLNKKTNLTTLINPNEIANKTDKNNLELNSGINNKEITTSIDKPEKIYSESDIKSNLRINNEGITTNTDKPENIYSELDIKSNLRINNEGIITDTDKSEKISSELDIKSNLRINNKEITTSIDKPEKIYSESDIKSNLRINNKEITTDTDKSQKISSESDIESKKVKEILNSNDIENEISKINSESSKKNIPNPYNLDQKTGKNKSELDTKLVENFEYLSYGSRDFIDTNKITDAKAGLQSNIKINNLENILNDNKKSYEKDKINLELNQKPVNVIPIETHNKKIEDNKIISLSPLKGIKNSEKTENSLKKSLKTSEELKLNNLKIKPSSPLKNHEKINSIDLTSTDSSYLNAIKQEKQSTQLKNSLNEIKKKLYKDITNPLPQNLEIQNALNKPAKVNKKPLKDLQRASDSQDNFDDISINLSGFSQPDIINSLSPIKKITTVNKLEPKRPELNESIFIKQSIELNPIEPRKEINDTASIKQQIALNPLKKKEKVFIDPALLQKNPENEIFIQAPASLPPLVEESIMIEEFGESLAERQNRLKKQRDLIVGQKKAERRKAIEKYLAEGGPDLLSKVPAKLSQTELEKRRSIISKLKSMNENT